MLCYIVIFYLVNEVLNIIFGKSLEERFVATCGVECSISFLCTECRIKKGELCKNYHLVNNSKWFSIISRKFNKTKLIWLIDELAKFSGYDFEVLLRQLFESVYQIKCDKGYDFWKKKISLKSITQRSNPVSSNYWCNLIFKILELKCKDVDLNCIISKNNLIIRNKIN